MDETQFLLIEGPSKRQDSPKLEKALEQTLKETEEKLKASECENQKLSVQLDLLKKERQNEVDKMMAFNYRLLDQLTDLRDDHEALKRTVTASNDKFEDKLANFKVKVNAQEKKINRNKEFVVSLTNDLYGKSANTRAIIDELEEDVADLTQWMEEMKQATDVFEENDLGDAWDSAFPQTQYYG
ncbi:hypothetical protein ACLX1H_003652 [Fusarium chlamydosporum]